MEQKPQWHGSVECMVHCAQQTALSGKEHVLLGVCERFKHPLELVVSENLQSVITEE